MVVDAPAAIPQLAELDGERIQLNPHYGQSRAWQSTARFIFMLAGTQGGKTSWLPWWLWREIERTARTGELNDYLAVSATFDLFQLKLLPEMRGVFERQVGWGRYWSSNRVIELRDLDPRSPRYGEFYATRADDEMWGRIILRSAKGESGLESATAKAAILDECGMGTFSLQAWEAVQRRLSLFQGRVLAGTTLYNLGWLKSQIYDPWLEAGGEHPDIDIIQFASIINPLFPHAEWERVKSVLPRWKLLMYYMGMFDRPPGLIYDVFDEHRMVLKPFSVPESWTRYGGLDFGGPNLVAVCFAESPYNGKLYLVREYVPNQQRPIWEHAQELSTWGCARWVGGSASEEQWRDEFRFATNPSTGESYGIPVEAPDVKEVEVGIDRCYALFKQHRVSALKSCNHWLDEVGTYSRELDDAGEPTEKIANKSDFHLMDATRYILGWYGGGMSGTGGIHVG